ncbi:MAG: nucleoside deaminase [Alphaproteobacteria bacterium]|nr:nucleoside deaminase [Alphaproteobacteria bacterium]
METALQEAIEAGKRNSIPVGAVIVKSNKIISSAGNEVKKAHDSTAHAEILAIRRACSILKTPILEDCDMYVTLEPCAMCAQAISLARIRRLYFGAYDVKYGAVTHGCRVFEHALHKTEIISGIFETQCKKILVDFFKTKRY